MEAPRRRGRSLTRLLVLLLLSSGLAQDGARAQDVEDSQAEPSGPIPVRIGWQVLTAGQGEMSQVIKRTDLFEQHGLDPRLVPYTGGPDQVEAALEGKLDVLFIGDQPVVNLVSRGGQWSVLARLLYGRVALVVPPSSPIQSVADLPGRTVGVPLGTAVHRLTMTMETEGGVDPASVDHQAVDPYTVNRLTRSGGQRWGDYDAFAVWEPNLSRMEAAGTVRPLSITRGMGVILVSDDFRTKHPEATVELLAALLRTWHFVATEHDQVLRWYRDDVRRNLEPSVVDPPVDIEPNFAAATPSDVDLSLEGSPTRSLLEAERWAVANGFADRRVDIREHMDEGPLNAAERLLAEGDYPDPQVIMPSVSQVPEEAAASMRVIDRIPLWAVFGIMILGAFVASEGGQRLGEWRRRKGDTELSGAIGTVAGAILGLLAFVIGLTFAAAHARYDARKQALLEEVNAIGTANLRAKLLDEPHRTTVQFLFREYVETRLGMYRLFGEPEQLRALESRTESIQSSLWTHAEELAEEDSGSEIVALFVDSLNTVFDLHTERVVLGARYRIPTLVWASLGVVSFLALLVVGVQFGSSGKRSASASISLGLTFATVLFLVFDLDRPGEGFVEVNQSPMRELYRDLSGG